jgi:hypothetical protein
MADGNERGGSNSQDREVLVRELQQLRRGHGLHAADIVQRIGPRLAEIVRLTPTMSAGERRQRLTERVRQTVLTLPEDLRIAVQAAFALEPASQSRFLRERMLWLGSQMGRDPRTAMRRVESGLTLLAERLLSLDADSDGESGRSNQFAPDGWYVERLRSSLLMHVNPVELLETRMVTSTRAGLAQLTVSWSIPVDVPDAEIQVEMLYGGELIRNDAVSTSSYWSGTVVLPQPLAIGERHEYQVRVVSLPRQYLRPYYVLTPFRRFDEFELRAKFDPAATPTIWKLDGVPFQFIDESQPIGEVLVPDAVGEVSSLFRNLHQGFSYGLRWS